MARIHGRTGAIAISANTSPAGSPADNEFVAVGSLRSWTLSFERELLENTSLRSAAKSYLVALSDIMGVFEGVFDTTYIATLVAASDDTDAVWLRITPSTGYPELFFQGSAWLNVTVTGNVNDAVKVSGKFVGNSVWTKSFSA